MMKREPGFMGLAKQNAKKKPMSKEQQQFRQQLGGQMQADRAQEQGMVDKMSAFNRMQQDKQRMMDLLAIEKAAFDQELEVVIGDAEAFEEEHDVSQLDNICNKAIAISDRMTKAREKIADFNTRDAAFGWDETEYPILDQAVKRFAPFLNVWSMSSEFQMSVV